MKRIFTALTIGLLLSTPHTAHPRALRNIFYLTSASIVGFSAHKQHEKAVQNGSSNPKLAAALTGPDILGEALVAAADIMNAAGVSLIAAVEDKRQELIHANKPPRKEITADTAIGDPALKLTAGPAKIQEEQTAKTQGEATTEQPPAPASTDSANTESK